MNRVQFLDSLRRQLEDLPSRQREEIVEVYSEHIKATVARGIPERDAVEKLGAPAACARDARAGRLPNAPAPQIAALRKSSNPFEPQMAAKPQRVKAQKLDRERQRHPEEPQGKKPWALVIVVTIAALLCLAFVLLRVLSSDGNLGYTELEQSFALDEVQSIVVEDADKAVRVSALTSSDIRVNYYRGHHEDYELRLEDGTLYIKAFSQRKWYDTLLSFYDTTVPVLNLYIPPTFGGSISLTTSNGNIEILGALTTDDMALCSSNGSISLTDVTVEGTLSVVTSNGPIALTNTEAAETIALASSNGAMTLQGIDCAEMDLHTTNGTIRAYELSERIQAIEIETSNSSVTGSIHGAQSDFSIDAETANGRNHLTNQSGGNRELTIRTSNGTIDFEFIS